jgi:hypothetical protein
MKIWSILAELRSEREAIDKVIDALEALSGEKRAPVRPPGRRPHWTQRPENRAKVRRIIRAAQKAKAR